MKISGRPGSGRNYYNLKGLPPAPPSAYEGPHRAAAIRAAEGEPWVCTGGHPFAWLEGMSRGRATTGGPGYGKAF